MWGVQKTHNLTKEYTYRVRTLIWPFYFNLDLCELESILNLYRHINFNYLYCFAVVLYLICSVTSIVIILFCRSAILQKINNSAKKKLSSSAMIFLEKGIVK